MRKHLLAFVAAAAVFTGHVLLANDALARGAEAKHMCSVRVPVRYTTASNAARRLGGTMAFSACDAERCLIEKVALSTLIPTTA